MAIANIAIKRRLREYEVNLHSGETTVKGVVTQVAGATVNKKLTIVPLTKQDLISSREGQYTIEDIKAYEVGPATIPHKSIINFNGKKYEVDMISDRNVYGQFTIYIAKKLNDNV